MQHGGPFAGFLRIQRSPGVQQGLDHPHITGAQSDHESGRVQLGGIHIDAALQQNLKMFVAGEPSLVRVAKQSQESRLRRTAVVEEERQHSRRYVGIVSDDPLHDLVALDHPEHRVQIAVRPQDVQITVSLFDFNDQVCVPAECDQEQQRHDPAALPLPGPPQRGQRQHRQKQQQPRQARQRREKDNHRFPGFHRHLPPRMPTRQTSDFDHCRGSWPGHDLFH